MFILFWKHFTYTSPGVFQLYDNPIKVKNFNLLVTKKRNTTLLVYLFLFTGDGDFFSASSAITTNSDKTAKTTRKIDQQKEIQAVKYQ